MKIRIKSNLAGGILTFGFAAVLWILIPLQISLMNNNAYIDARFVPRIVAIAIGIGGLSLILQSIFGKDTYIELNLRKEAKAVLYIGLLILYAYLLPVAGYLITTPVLGIMTLLISGEKNKKYYAVTLALVGILYCIFTFLLKIKLP